MVPASGALATDDHLKERGLAGAVGSDDADDAARRQPKGHLFKQQPVAVSLGNAFGLNHQVPQARPGRNVDLEVPGMGGALLGQQFFVGADARLGLALTRLGAHPDPLQLALQGLAAVAFGLFLLAQALLLLLQPRGVIALPGNAVAAVQFQDPAGHVVEKVAVVGDGDDGALVLLQMVLQPGHGLGVQVVGGFIQQQDVRFLEQQPAEGHPAFFTAGEHLDLPFRPRGSAGRPWPCPAGRPGPRRRGRRASPGPPPGA